MDGRIQLRSASKARLVYWPPPSEMVNEPGRAAIPQGHVERVDDEARSQVSAIDQPPRAG
jgi:hypothetical protein